MSQSAKPNKKQDEARRGWPGALRSDAHGLTEAAVRRAGFPDPALVFRWADIAGPDTARVARPVRCRAGAGGLVLTIRCEPAASVFLQHETRALLERVNAFLGARAVARIQVVTGALSAEPALPPRPKLRTFPPENGQLRPLENALKRLDFLRGSVARKRPPARA